MLMWRALLLNLVSHRKFYSALAPDRKTLLSNLFIIHTLKCGKLKSDLEKEKKKGGPLTEVLCFNVIHRPSVGRMEDPQLNTD